MSAFRGTGRRRVRRGKPFEVTLTPGVSRADWERALLATDLSPVTKLVGLALAAIAAEGGGGGGEL